MARKKDDSVEMAAINFRCEAELKASLEDLAASAKKDVSAILIELVEELVELNKARIEEFRKAAATPIIKPSTATPSTPKKSARTPRKKKDAAQMDGESVISVGNEQTSPFPTHDSDELKGGDDVAENS